MRIRSVILGATAGLPRAFARIRPLFRFRPITVRTFISFPHIFSASPLPRFEFPKHYVLGDEKSKEKWSLNRVVCEAISLEKIEVKRRLFLPI